MNIFKDGCSKYNSYEDLVTVGGGRLVRSFLYYIGRKGGILVTGMG